MITQDATALGYAYGIAENVWEPTVDIDEIARRLKDLEDKVDQIDIRLSSVEQNVATTLELFGDYKNRTAEELSLMSGQIGALLRSVESLVATAENKSGTERAKSLRRRLLNNQTRVNKQLNLKKHYG